jgi:hypothetical protein
MKLYINETEKTNELLDALDKPIVVTLQVGNNEIEVHSEKPLSRLYWSVNSAHGGSLTLKYFNGSSFDFVDVSTDTTAALTQQGWVTWERASDDAKDGGLYKYIFFISGVSAPSRFEMKFVGVVFSEDRDLKKECPNVVDYLAGQDTSFIRFHVAAKDSIVQWFRGKGNTTYNGVSLKAVDEFDFIDPSELAVASRFMTLGKIFHWLSDSADDKYYQKARDFMAEAHNSLDVFYISIDKNADAKPDESEMVQNTVSVLTRG